MYEVDWELLDRLEVPRSEFEGRTALVTGAARGIGEATAVTLAALGAEVVLVDRSVDAGRAVAASIQRAGGRAKFLRCDLSRVGAINRVIPRALRAFGKIDLLVNNALHMSISPLQAMKLKDWEFTFAVNTRAPYLIIKSLLPAMLERGKGTIVNVVAYEGTAFGSAYSATKMANRSMARSVSQELPAGCGVQVFSYVPGIVDTPLVHETIVAQFSALTGADPGEVLEGLAQNPGFQGLMPREHCVAGLVYCLAHGEEYNGQVADPFDPLERHGIIELPVVDTSQPPAREQIAGIPLDIKNYLTKVSDLNHDLQHRIELRTRELEEARSRSEGLLLNILPSPIAERLKQGENMIVDHFDQATVLFADIADFTPLSTRLTPQQLVELLDEVFSVFDEIVGRYELEKIKTIGDCYMVVGGIPRSTPDHSDQVARAALEMLPALDEVRRKVGVPLEVRMGLHTGPVVAGVIGRQKFIYDLWGDTVNTASRMESHGQSSRIHCTAAVHERLKDSFRFDSRGDIDIKGKGTMSTYFLTGVK